MKVRLISLLILVMILLAACSGPSAPVASTPFAQTPAAQTPSVQTPSVQTPTGEEQVALQASQAAQQALADQLGVSPAAVQIDKIEAAQWPDACLGLPQPGEACAEVITPGYSLTVRVNGQTYEVHTNQNGQSVRLANENAGVPDGSQPAAVDKAREALANRLGIQLDQVTMVSVERVEWPNGCLGLEKPDEMCTMAIVPGYRIILEANGTEHVFHTDRDGSQVREASAGGQIEGQGVAITWSRSGGIAGFCDQLMVFAEGQAWASTCKNSETRARAQLSPEQLSTLADWTQRFTSFTFEQKDPATADAMTLTLLFSGSGQQVASDADKAAMLEFAAQIYTAATANP